MDGAVCLRETAFCFITAYAPEKVDVGVFWTSFLEKFFRFDEKKQLRLSQLYVILVVHIPSRNDADHAFPAEYGKRTELKGTEQL